MTIKTRVGRAAVWAGALAASAALLAGLGGAGPSEATGGVHAPASDPAGLTPPVYRRQVQIAGRTVTVQLLLKRVIPGAPLVGGQRPTTTAEVDVWVNDGALLPAGLSARNVRLQKQFGRREVVITPLSETMFDGGQGILGEIDGKSFDGTIVSTPNAQRLDATVRLTFNGQVVRVPFGVVNVFTVALP